MTKGRPKLKLFEDDRISAIPQIVADLMDVDLIEVINPKRHQSGAYSMARSIIVGLSSEISGMSLSMIANQFKMATSTVKSAMSRHEAYTFTDDNVYMRAYDVVKEEQNNNAT